MSLQGTILGYTADIGTGAITGADGRRYKFAAAAWKGQGAPVPGTPVDFELADGGQAADIYPLKAQSATPAQPDGEPAPDLGKYVAMAGRKPGLVAGAMALVISAFIGFVEVTAPRGSGPELPPSATVLGTSDIIGAAKRAFAEREASYSATIEQRNDAIEQYQSRYQQMEGVIDGEVSRYTDTYQRYGSMYGYRQSPEDYEDHLRRQNQEDRDELVALETASAADTQNRLDRLNQDKALINLGYLLYLIPLSAALVAFLDLTGRPTRLASILFVASVGASIGLIYFARSRLGSLFGDLGAEAPQDREMASELAVSSPPDAVLPLPNPEAALIGEALLSPALGAWLLLATAAGLLALSFGLVKIRAA